MLPLLLCVMLADPRVEPKGKAEVRLEFSSKTFDPLKPGKETVKGVLINNTGKPIQVPSFYDGTKVQLIALPREKGFGRWEMNLFVRAGVRTTVEVKPMKRHVLFELKLAEVLPVKREGKAMYGWSWPARSAPPSSPAAGRTGVVTPGKIKFVVRFAGEGGKAESPPVELEIVEGKK